MLLSIAYKRLNNLDKSIEVLSECVNVFPSYADAFLARAQAHVIQRKHEQALADFTAHARLVPQKALSFLGMGDCQKQLDRLD